MKKSDLKSGMQIEQRDGDRMIVFIDSPAGDVFVKVNGDDCDRLNMFDEDLCHEYNKEYDVVKIYSSDDITGYNNKISSEDLIWERKEDSIVTFDGVDYSESTLRSLIQKATK